MLTAGQGKVAHNMQTMTATHSPAWNNTDHHFAHETNDTLNIEYIETLHAVGPLIPFGSPNFLITARAKCIDPIVGRPLSGEQNNADRRVLACINKCFLEFEQGLRPKCISYFGAVKGNSRNTVHFFIGDVAVLFHRSPLDGFASHEVTPSGLG